MKSQRYTTRLFSLILSVSVLMSGFASSGYSRSRHLVSSLAPPLTPAAQDGGESWKPVNAGLSSLNIAALAIDPVNSATIYAGTRGGGMFKSINGGATWSKNALNSRYVSALAIDFVNPNIVYAGTDDGGWCSGTFPIFKSTDGGTTWSNANSPADCGITMLVMDPTSPNTLYAGSEGQYLGSGSIQLWKTTDGGATWRVVFFGNPGLSPLGLAVNPANPQTLYAPGDFYTNINTIDSGLFKSTDGGSNWSATGLEPNHGYTYIRAVAIDPLNPSTLYAGSTNNGMFKSINGGANWLAINNGRPNSSVIWTIVVDRENPNILYIGTSDGVFKSTDSGANWSAFNDGLTNLDIRVLTLAPGNPNTLYAGTLGGVFKITDNTTAKSPIDDARSFVRQHYRDFLNREPDAAGLVFWTDNITKCTDAARRPAAQTEAQCIDQQNVTTSAAFFLSPEFQYTGYFVYRLYKGSLLQNAQNGAGRFPTFQEFLRDVRQVAGGIIQNSQLSASAIEANKKTFAEEFTQRAEFRNLYDPLSNFDYVERLFQITGINVSAQDKEALVAGLNNQTETRASVLQKVVDGTVVIAEGNQQFTTVYGRAFYDKEFNAAFVLMEYFGYLRRDPDPAGFQNWLNKLDTYGNYIDAEMVKSFIVSPEYRARFGQP